MNDKVTFLSQEKAAMLAEQMNWPLAFAEGYIAGQSERWRGNPLSSYVTVGTDHFARGFRAGYFERPTPERDLSGARVQANTAVSAT